MAKYFGGGHTAEYFYNLPLHKYKLYQALFISEMSGKEKKEESKYDYWKEK